MKHQPFLNILGVFIMVNMQPVTITATDSTTDQQTYFVFRNGKKVGALISQIGYGPHETRMYLESKITGRLLIELQVNQTLEVTVSNGRMVYAGLVRKINGSTQINRQIQLQSTGYKISGTRCTCRSIPREITFTSTHLFFTEPIGQTELFSETLGTMVPVSQKSPGVYRLLLPDGDWSDYYYRNGILTRIVSKSFYGEVEMVLQ